MDTFTVRDLRERSGEWIRHAEEGKLSIITKNGHPVFVVVPFDETLPKEAPLVTSKAPTCGHPKAPTQDVVNCNPSGRDRSVF